MEADTLGLASGLAMLGIYMVSDLVGLARAGVLHELIVNAADHQNLEQRATEAFHVHTSVAAERVSRLSQANARAEAAELRVKELERQCAEAEAKRPVSLSLQIHPQLKRGGMAHARTQTPILIKDQISVSTQAPSPQEAAAAAKQQRQLYHQLEERAQEQARDSVVPLLQRSVDAAEAAERSALQKVQDTKKLLEAIRCTAERRAREAAAATADRVAAAVDRAAACEERAAAAKASLVTTHEFEVELAVLCRCLSEQEEENIDLEDTIMGLYEFLQRAREGPCRLCSES
jgi:hypothetical protein